MTIDVILEIAQKQGMFVALVLFVIWESRSREAKFSQREQDYIQETKEREEKYIEREEKYRDIIQELTTTLSGYTEMQEDVSHMRSRFDILEALAIHSRQNGGTS